MELNQEYDFAIIGEHPAGLWAAHHLIGLGKKVIVLPLGTENSMNVLPRKVAEVFQIPESW